MPPPRKNRAAKQVELAERRARACQMAIKGHTYESIAQAMGYSSRTVAFNDVKRALILLREEQRKAATELQAVSVARLEAAILVVTEIMEKDHIAHSGGKIVEYEDPDTGDIVTLRDDDPKMKAAETLRKLEESKRKLLGLDAPTKVQATVDATVGYRIDISAEEMEGL